MAWRGTRIEDVIVHTLYRYGPQSVAELVEAIRTHHPDEYRKGWAKANEDRTTFDQTKFKRDPNGSGTITDGYETIDCLTLCHYSNTYPKLVALERKHRVQRDTSKSTHKWRVADPEELARLEAAERAALEPDSRLVKRAEAAASALDATVEFAIERERYQDRYVAGVIVNYPRGKVVVPIHEKRDWNGACVEAGLWT